MADPYDLQRFVVAQESSYDRALAELRAGQKRSHWMWFIFPQLAGLGFSSMAQRYAIRSLAEATAYLDHPVLGPRLLVCVTAVLNIDGRTAYDIFGSPDDLKLRSSATLFQAAAAAPAPFQQLLDRYFAGQPDPRTRELLAKQRT